MSRLFVKVDLSEADLLTIIPALEMYQKDALDQLRNRYGEMKDADRDFYERQPAFIARILRRMDSSWDELTKSS